MTDNSMNIAIYGAGGFGKEVACLIERINNAGGSWQFKGFYDDGKPVGAQIGRYGAVLGGLDELLQVDEPLAIAFAINDNSVVARLRGAITNKNITFPNLVDPSVFIVDLGSMQMGVGNIIQYACMISCDASIGDFNIINDHAVVGHDCHIGSFNGIMPSAHLSGGVTVGDRNLLGVASVVLQGLEIGHGVTLGANSVLMTRPKDDSTYLGVPAKKFDY